MAGGAGFVSGMISSIRYNKSILGKRKSFKEIREDFKYVRSKNLTEVEYQAEILELRRKLKNDVRKEKIKNFFSLTLTLIVSIVIFYLIIRYLLY